MRAHLLTLCLSIVAMLAIVPDARSQASWPTRPIRLILSSPPGGAVDLIARLIQVPLQEGLGQTLVIEARTGSGGIIAWDAVAKAGDGHTVGMVGTALAALPALHKNLPFDTLRDLAPIALLVRSPVVIAVGPAAPFRSLPELIAAAKARPGSLSYGHTGMAQGPHIVGEAFKLRAGVDIVQVPYRGAGPAMLAAAGGEVPIVWSVLGGMVPFIQSGKLRPLALAGGERLSSFPDVPTVEEQGYPGFRMEEWFGIVGPASMPADGVRRLNGEINRALGLPAVSERLRGLAFRIVPMSPEQFRSFIESETKTTRAVIEAAKITVE